MTFWDDHCEDMRDWRYRWTFRWEIMKKKLYHSQAWLKLQRSKGKTITEIAKECGVSAQIINVYLIKFGLK